LLPVGHNASLVLWSCAILKIMWAPTIITSDLRQDYNSIMVTKKQEK
jgi:hypothetical protein